MVKNVTEIEEMEKNSQDLTSEERWYVLRDLQRANSSKPAYRVLPELGVKVFTPMTVRISRNKNQIIKERVPYIHGLLFAYGTREQLDPIVEPNETLIYRYLRGHYKEPMVVPTAEMERFILFVESSDSPQYLMPEEINPSMYGSKVLIKGGSFDGLECQLLKSQGSKKKRIIVEIQNLIAVCVEVSDFEYLVPLK